MKNKISYSAVPDDLAVTPLTLHEVFGVPAKTMDNGMSLFKTKQNKHWAYVMNDKGKMILVRTIPKPTLEKYNIPLEGSDIIKKIDVANETSNRSTEGEQLNSLSQELQKFCNEEWPYFVSNYSRLSFKVLSIYAQKLKRGCSS